MSLAGTFPWMAPEVCAQNILCLFEFIFFNICEFTDLRIKGMSPIFAIKVHLGSDKHQAGIQCRCSAMYEGYHISWL